ncbi:MAG: protein kinase [Planctomycetes bacterium]|nr:protein kinase [Planctomycetota bacterium]MBL7146461.1 protein kinase [Phycisphaerae bacterium]
MKDLKKIRSVFCEALEKETQEEREAYLAQACQDDLILRTEIDTLLRTHSKANDFFKGPLFGSEIPEDNLSEAPGTIIDRYKLLEKIGEGGMAVVYMADQQEPISRKVALKIIKLGMDTKSVIARFEAERQALAMMDHPNIAKVLDAGATETGRPYFVMELVTGVSITEYCDKNNLSTKERLSLFIQVCNAVQHAHQKGIIHRDIKPTNVMVTKRDGELFPKVIDFGIAKATRQRLTEKTLFTRYAHIIGTPAYMSPEQADLSDLEVDTRSDIYSLGILLYELLTGTTPFSEEELRKAGYLEMQRMIREQEPTKPSTKLTTLGEILTDIAKRRGCTPDLLTKSIRGDLDWIVMKTLEKARDRRYDNASALALDVKHHLDNQPILARAPSTLYSLRKFLYRHRVEALAAVALFIMVSILGVALSVWGYNKSQLEKELEMGDRMALYRCRYSCGAGDIGTALLEITPILNSKYVGDHAHIMLGHIQRMAQLKINDLTGKIEDNPEDADNYLQRAYYCTLLNDNEQISEDMDKYVAVLNPSAETDLRNSWIQKFLIGLWDSAPTNLGPIVNSSYWDMGPCISPDGRELYFHSDRPSGLGGYDIWVTNRETVQDPWGEPVHLGPTVNSSSWDCNTGISADGLSLYIMSNRPGGSGDLDTWVTMRASISEPWGEPVNLGPTINSSAEDAGTISADGLSLIICSNRSGGYGGHDIYVSTRATTDDPWGEPVNLGPTVNSSAWDWTPFLTADGLSLIFTSERPSGLGRSDFWLTTRDTTKDLWAEPVNLGPTINSSAYETFPYISADGSTIFFHSNRPSEFGGPDLWQMSITPILGSMQTDGDAETEQKSLESNNGKEVVAGNNH